VEKLAEQRKPADWEDAKAELINSDCSPGQSALQLMARGVAYGKKGDHDRAIAEYNEAIRLDPKLSAAFYNRGTAYLHKGDHDRGIADFDEAIRLEPNDAFLFAARGGAYGLKEQYDRALADYGEAMRLSPKETHLSPEIDASFLCGRGEVYLGKGDEDRAIADFDEAIRLDPKAASAFFGRGRAYKQKGDYDRAIADLDEAIRLNAENADYFSTRGDAYFDKGDYDRAIADYDEAIRLNPNFTWAINLRASAIAMKNELRGGASAETLSASASARECSEGTSEDGPTAEVTWDYFRGKPNTKAVLEEKAGVVAALIIQFWDNVLLIAAVFKIAVHNFWCAIDCGIAVQPDCGIAVQPDNVAAQTESSIVYGLGLALSDVPPMHIEVISTDNPPTGVGQMGTPL
jgi:tetratricopeptide (TPR) repeat protein